MFWTTSHNGDFKEFDLTRDGEWFVFADGQRARVIPGQAAGTMIVECDQGKRITLLTAKNGNAVEIVDGDRRYQFEIHRGREQDVAAADTTSNSNEILSPLPGRIVEIMVQPGDTVTAGQPVCIIEAMKMQNEIAAPRDGTVAEVVVNVGDAVEGDVVLVQLEPAKN